MTTTDNKAQVEDLIDRAAKAKTANDALHYSQAALNCANAMCALISAKKS